MKAMFQRYFSIEGRLIKCVHERCRDFKFDPNTEDIEVFISNVKQTADQLNDNDVAVLNFIKAYIPTDIYGN